MKYIYSLLVIITLFSCNSTSRKIIGKWYVFNFNDNRLLVKLDGSQDQMGVVSLEFNKDGNVFYTLAGTITPYKWELSNDKISLTSPLSAETIEVIENRLLWYSYQGMPMLFIKEGDNISHEEFEAIIKRNIEKIPYLKAIRDRNK